jgi:D-alanyl-D-alanine carboxypeptidase/D-alanyl-D-alanine-endopeptidase (penicillin-binding protein 4)
VAVGRPRFALALAAVAVLGSGAWVGRRVNAPEPARLGAPTEVLPFTGPYRIVPDLRPLPTAAERLERRLEAFARAVEVHARAHAGDRPAAELDVDRLDAALRDVVDDLGDRAQISVHVRDLGDDVVLFDYFGDVPLNPASNQKLLTSAAALDLLGSDYTFLTRFFVRDETLWLVGDGDPSLDAETLWSAAARLTELVDVASLARIVVDDTAFSERRFGPGYDPEGIGWSYQAPSGAVSLEFNGVQVTVYPVAGALRPAVVIHPESSHVKVENRARIGRGKTTIAIRSRADGEDTVVEVSGRMAGHAPPVTERRRIHDPARFTGGALAVALAQASGTEPLPVERGVVPWGEVPMLVHESAPLAEIVGDELAWSNNFVAEQLVRTLGWRMSGMPGDWERGTDVLRGYWSALGLDDAGLAFENGSGFSAQGRVTASALSDLIAVAHRVQGAGGLIDALPVAGEEGTLRARLRKSGKRVRAKTGTLDGVSGLSGVITAEDGTPQLAFSILINATQAGLPAASRREVEDRIVMEVLRAIDDYQARAGFLAFDPEWVSGGDG